jgi:hypothetical protein
VLVPNCIEATPLLASNLTQSPVVKAGEQNGFKAANGKSTAEVVGRQLVDSRDRQCHGYRQRQSE